MGYGTYLEQNTRGDLGIESEHALFFAGQIFDFHLYVASVANGASSDVLIAIPSTIGFLHVGSLDVGIGGGPMRVFLYEGTTVSSNGTPVSVVNTNRLSSNTAATAVFSGPTVTGIGTQIHFDFIPAGKQVGGNTSGFTYWDHKVLKPNTNYLFRVTNDSGLVQAVHQHLIWFESSVNLIMQ